MTSDFERKSNPYGTAGSAGTPAEITVGGSGATQSGFGNNTSIREPDAGTGTGATSPGSDADRAKGVIDRETSAAKAELGNVTRDIKDGASNLAASAREKAAEGVEAGKSQLTSSLGDFAAAVRKASDELGERDQSMAAGLVREVANGLEQATGSIEGRSVQDLTRSVAAFARRQPTTFLIGAALAGIALGRFARASSEHGPVPGGASRGYDDDRYGSAYDRSEDRDRSLTPGRSAASQQPSRPVSPPVSSGTSAPRPASVADTPASYAGPSTSGGGSGSAASVTGGSLSAGATSSGSAASTSSARGPAPAEGPSGAVLGHGSGSFNPQGGRDDR